MILKGIHKPTIEDVVEISGIESLHPGGFKLTKRCAEIANINKNTKVLDVASGRGTQVIYYAKEFRAQVTGLDISEEMVKSAQNYAKKENLSNFVNFVQGDSQTLPFKNNSFDIVINECAVGLTEDSQKVLNEMARVLKPNGTLIIHETIWRKKLDKNFKEEFSERYGTTPLEIEEWKEMMKRAGLSNITFEDMPWSKPEMFWKIRKDRNVKKASKVFTTKERLITIYKIYKKYRFKGLLKALENEKLFYKAIKEEKIGYCLYKATKNM